MISIFSNLLALKNRILGRSVRINRTIKMSIEKSRKRKIDGRAKI
jgi:hypothetical protein